MSYTGVAIMVCDSCCDLTPPFLCQNYILSMFWAQTRMILMWMRLHLSPGSAWGQLAKCWATGPKRKKYNRIHDSVCSKENLKEKVEFTHSEGPEEEGTRQCFPSQLVPLEPELGGGALVGPEPSLGGAGWPALPREVGATILTMPAES